MYKNRVFFISDWQCKSSESSTYKWLVKRYGKKWVASLSPCEFGTDYPAALFAMGEKIEPNDIVVAEGFGCFVANTFFCGLLSRCDCEQVWIRPCLSPLESIPEFSALPDSPFAGSGLCQSIVKADEWLGRDTRKSYRKHLVRIVCATSDDPAQVSAYTSFPIVSIQTGGGSITDIHRDEYLKPLIDSIVPQEISSRLSQELTTEEYYDYSTNN